ncbi:MAG: hypothetical protein JKY61_11255 [Planctomycetes bacterium]|nr:hypothetical protein [Planctomycetota bacterium]
MARIEDPSDSLRRSLWGASEVRVICSSGFRVLARHRKSGVVAVLLTSYGNAASA